MGRKNKIKIILKDPKFIYFKPAGIRMYELEEITLNIEEIEAIRLSDLKKLNQSECAKIMKIHQSTFQRLLTKARNKIANALINGYAIKIEGGNYMKNEK